MGGVSISVGGGGGGGGGGGDGGGGGGGDGGGGGGDGGGGGGGGGVGGGGGGGDGGGGGGGDGGGGGEGGGGGGGEGGDGGEGGGGSKPKPIKDVIIDLLIHPCGGLSKLETIKCVLDFLSKPKPCKEGDDCSKPDNEKPENEKPENEKPEDNQKPNNDNDKCKCKGKAQQRTFEEIGCFFECLFKPKPEEQTTQAITSSTASSTSSTTMSSSTSSTSSSTSTTTTTTTTTSSNSSTSSTSSSTTSSSTTTTAKTTTTKKPDNDKCKCRRKFKGGKVNKKILDCLVECFIASKPTQAPIIIIQPPQDTSTTTTKKPDHDDDDKECKGRKKRTIGCLIHNLFKPTTEKEQRNDDYSYHRKENHDYIDYEYEYYDDNEEGNECRSGKKTVGCIFQNIFKFSSTDETYIDNDLSEAEDENDRSSNLLGKFLSGDLRIVI